MNKAENKNGRGKGAKKGWNEAGEERRGVKRAREGMMVGITSGG